MLSSSRDVCGVLCFALCVRPLLGLLMFSIGTKGIDQRPEFQADKDWGTLTESTWVRSSECLLLASLVPSLWGLQIQTYVYTYIYIYINVYK